MLPDVAVRVTRVVKVSVLWIRELVTVWDRWVQVEVTVAAGNSWVKVRSTVSMTAAETVSHGEGQKRF